jgi:hypothetical protein
MILGHMALADLLSLLFVVVFVLFFFLFFFVVSLQLEGYMDGPLSFFSSFPFLSLY